MIMQWKDLSKTFYNKGSPNKYLLFHTFSKTGSSISKTGSGNWEDVSFSRFSSDCSLIFSKLSDQSNIVMSCFATTVQKQKFQKYCWQVLKKLGFWLLSQDCRIRHKISEKLQFLWSSFPNGENMWKCCKRPQNIKCRIFIFVKKNISSNYQNLRAES